MENDLSIEKTVARFVVTHVPDLEAAREHAAGLDVALLGLGCWTRRTEPGRWKEGAAWGKVVYLGSRGGRTSSSGSRGGSGLSRFQPSRKSCFRLSAGIGRLRLGAFGFASGFVMVATEG
jgi:hypothetical protein